MVAVRQLRRRSSFRFCANKRKPFGKNQDNSFVKQKILGGMRSLRCLEVLGNTLVHSLYTVVRTKQNLMLIDLFL